MNILNIQNSMREQTTTISTSTVHPQRVIKSTTISDSAGSKEFTEKKTIFRFYQIIWYILAIIEILLGFRFILKLIGANPFTGFSSFIYSISSPFARPFLGLVSAGVSGNNVVEWPTLIAMAVYLVVAYLIIEFLKLIKPVSKEEVENTVDNT